MSSDFLLVYVFNEIYKKAWLKKNDIQQQSMVNCSGKLKFLPLTKDVRPISSSKKPSGTFSKSTRKSPRNKEPLSMAKPEETTIGDRIKFIRGSLTQITFAEAIGTGRSTLQQWEANGGFPTGEFLSKIHKKFKVNLNWLLSGKGKPYLKRLKHPPNMENRIIRIESRISALEKKAKK